MKTLAFTVALWAAAHGFVEGGETQDLLQKQIESGVLGLHYGPTHPKVLGVRQQIQSLVDAGIQIDDGEAEEELARLLVERRVLRAHYGLDHPNMIANARKIECVASMLAR